MEVDEEGLNRMVKRCGGENSRSELWPYPPAADHRVDGDMDQNDVGRSAVCCALGISRDLSVRYLISSCLR